MESQRSFFRQTRELSPRERLSTLTRTMTLIAGSDMPPTPPVPGYDVSLELTADESGVQKSEDEEIPEGVLDLRMKTMMKRKWVATEEEKIEAAGSSKEPSATEVEEVEKGAEDSAGSGVKTAESAAGSKEEDAAGGSRNDPRPPVSFRMNRIPMAKVQAVWPKVFGRSVFKPS